MAELSPAVLEKLQRGFQDPNKREGVTNIINDLRQKGADTSQLTNLFPTGEQIPGTQGPSGFGEEMLNRAAQGINRGVFGTGNMIANAMFGAGNLLGDPETQKLNQQAQQLTGDMFKNQIRASIEAFPITEGAEDVSFELGTLLRGTEIFGETLPFAAAFQTAGLSQLNRLPAGTQAGRLPMNTTELFGVRIPNPTLPNRPLDAETLRNLSTFQKMLVDAARDPAKFQSIEAAISLAAAGAGRGADTEEGRILAELTGSIGAPLLFRIMTRLGSFVQQKFFITESQARTHVGASLALEIEDGATLRQLDEVEGLEREISGLDVTLGAATRNRKILAAEKALDIDTSDLDLENRRALFKYSKRIKQALDIPDTGSTEKVGIFQRDNPAAETFQARLGMVMEEELADIRKKLDENLEGINQKLFGEPDQLKRMDISDQAFSKLSVARARANETINHLYRQVEDFKIPPQALTPLRRAMFRAASKEKIGTDVSGDVQQILDRMGQMSFTPFRRVENIPESAAQTRIDPSTGLFVQPRRIERTPQGRNTLQEMLNVKRDINDVLEKARRQGDRPTIRRLAILRAGIEKTLDNVGNSTAAKGKNLALLRTANQTRREFAKIFEDHEMKTIFAQTGQGQLKIDPSDTLNYFVHPTKAVKRRAQSFKTATKNSPESMKLIENELMRRLKGAAFDDTKLELIPQRVEKFKKKYADVIESYGLQDKWKNVSKITEEFEANVRVLQAAEKDISRSVLSDFLGVDDLSGFMDNMFNNPTRLQRSINEIRQQKPQLLESYKQTLVEHFINEGISKQVAEIAPEIPEFSDVSLGKALQTSGAALRNILGGEHFEQLRRFFRGLQITKPVEGIPKALAPEETKLTRMTGFGAVLSLIRQVNQRVLSPQFVVTNLSVLAGEALRSRILRQTFKRALLDKKFAREIADAAHNKAIAPDVKTFFTPFFGRYSGSEVEIPQDAIEIEGTTQQGVQEIKNTKQLRESFGVGE